MDDALAVSRRQSIRNSAQLRQIVSVLKRETIDAAVAEISCLQPWPIGIGGAEPSLKQLQQGLKLFNEALTDVQFRQP
jgi:hypothetical protein